MRFSLFSRVIALASVAHFATPALSQITLTAVSSPATETFDALQRTAPVPLPPGWRVDAASPTTSYASAGTQTTQAAGTSGAGALSGSSVGGTYCFTNGNGNASAGERAVGWLSGGSNNYATGRNLFVRIVNSTGATLTGFTATFQVEKYRNGLTSNTISLFSGPDGNQWTLHSSVTTSFAADVNTNVVNPPSSVLRSATVGGLSLPPGASYYLRWNYTGTAAANAQALGVDNVSVTGLGPLISSSAASLPSFGTVRVGSSSSMQSYTVSALEVTDLITVTAPPSFEVSSTGAADDFHTSLSLSPSGTSLSSTTLYVRFTPSAHGAATGSIVHSSPGAASRLVSVSGSGDGVPPGVTISAPTAAETRGGPVAYTVVYTDAAAVTLQEADVSLVPTGTATATVSVSGSGTLSRTVTLSSVTGDGSLGIALAAGTAMDAVGNTAAAAGPSSTFLVDNTPPGISLGVPSPDLTREGPVSWTVTYQQASTVTLSAADITLLSTGSAAATTVTVTGTGTVSRVITASGISGEGTLAPQIAAGSAADAVGNTSTAAGPGVPVTVRTTGPPLTIGPPSAYYVRGGSVTYKAIYVDPSSILLTASDILLNTTGTATATAVVEVGESPSRRNIRLTGISGDGMISINIKPGTATDSAGNLSPGAGPSIPFVVDNTSPYVVEVLAATSQSLDVRFNEPLGPDSDLPTSYSVFGEGAGTLNLNPDQVVALSTDTMRLHWGGAQEMRHGTSLTLSVGPVTDLAGNPLGLPSSADTLGLGEFPTVTGLVPATPQELEIRFSEAVAGGVLSPDSYLLTGPGMGSVPPSPAVVTGLGPDHYRLSWSSGAMNGGLQVTVAATGVTDLAGNSLGVPNSATVMALPVSLSEFTIY